MKRKLGRLLARVQNVVKRVWRRLFPETTEEAQLPASRPRTIRGFDSVTDAEYEDVTAVSPTPAVDETPVLEWMSATTEAENRTLRATELAAELESFLKSNEPAPDSSALAEFQSTDDHGQMAPVNEEARASAAAEYSADVDAALTTAFEAGAFEESLGVEPAVESAAEPVKAEESTPAEPLDEPRVAEPADGAESVLMAAHIPQEPEELTADPIWAAPEVLASRDADVEGHEEIVRLHVANEGIVVEPAEEVARLNVATDLPAVAEPAVEPLAAAADEILTEQPEVEIRPGAESVSDADEALALEAASVESRDEPGEELVSAHIADEAPALEATTVEWQNETADVEEPVVESTDPDATDDIADHAPWTHFAAPEPDELNAAPSPEAEAPPAAELSSEADVERAVLESAATEEAPPADTVSYEDVAADDGVEAVAAADDATVDATAALLAAAGDEEPGASAEAMAAEPVPEPHHEKTWDEAALAELTADVSEATPVEEIAAAAEVDAVDELTASLDTGLDAEAALADAMAAVSEETQTAPAISASDIAVAAELEAVDIAEAAEEMMSAEAVALQAEHAAETARAVAQAEVEAAADAEPVPVAAAIRVPVPPIQIPSDYVPAAESGHAIYQLQLDGFEGPLDLLLHLIKRHHVDIFDIPVAFICEQYLKYLKMMEDLDIDVAAEFLFMASELLHIKSRLLLPKPEGEAVEEDDVDPRAELVRRLLEYQKYKDAAEKFSEFDRFNRDIFGRDAEDPPPALGEAPLKEVGLFALVKAFESVLKRQKPEVRHQVMMEQVSVRARIRVLLTQIENVTIEGGLRFEDLLADAHRRIDIVVTFLALLEMGKLKLLRIFQGEDGVIYLHPKFDDVTAAFARLEGIDESQYA